MAVAQLTGEQVEALAVLLKPYRAQIERAWGRREAARPSARQAELLTIPDVARELGVRSTNTVYRLIAIGQLASVDIGIGRPRTRVSRTALATFIDRRTAKR